MSPQLIVTVGLPLSGKTTWAKAQEGVVVVNPDSIRLALHGKRFIGQAEPYVWAIARTMVEHHFIYGYPTVILDATNGTIERRSFWIRPDQWETRFVVFDTPVEECVRRAEELGDSTIIPIIRRMNATNQALTSREVALLQEVINA